LVGRKNIVKVQRVLIYVFMVVGFMQQEETESCVLFIAKRTSNAVSNGGIRITCFSLSTIAKEASLAQDTGATERPPLPLTDLLKKSCSPEVLSPELND
jgi:hypothetical protein